MAQVFKPVLIVSWDEPDKGKLTAALENDLQS